MRKRQGGPQNTSADELARFGLDRGPGDTVICCKCACTWSASERGRRRELPGDPDWWVCPRDGCNRAMRGGAGVRVVEVE